MTRSRRLRGAALGLAVTGILALGACGGDDDDSSSDTTAATEATVDGGSTDTTEAGDDSSDTTFDTSDVDALSAEECRELYEQFTSLGFDPTGSEEPEDIEAAFDAIEDAVPDDLKEDVRVLADAYSRLLDLDSEGTPDVTDPEYLEALEELNTPEIQQASARLDAYFQNCEDAVED